ncbi:hypothetical protein V6N13_038923 [Hibiscus sabdariffa]|uniref:Uncharacterized protein n=1 Tax=Hibiscus sabdariffa TaxID=183260 RepID=A0ABR2SXV4_9ROSI
MHGSLNQAPPLVQWQRPPSGWYCLNTGAAFSSRLVGQQLWLYRWGYPRRCPTVIHLLEDVASMSSPFLAARAIRRLRQRSWVIEFIWGANMVADRIAKMSKPALSRTNNIDSALVS